MAQKKVWVGSMGPNLYDNEGIYNDGVKHHALRTEGQLRVEETPTEDYHVLRLIDLGLTFRQSAYSLFFPGEIQVTPFGSDQIIQPISYNGNGMQLISVQATCNTMLGISGTTKIRVCKVARGGAITASIVVSLAYNDNFAKSDGTIAVADGDLLYVFCEEAGGHQDLNIQIMVRG